MNNQSSISIVKYHCSLIKHNKTYYIFVFKYFYVYIHSNKMQHAMWYIKHNIPHKHATDFTCIKSPILIYFFISKSAIKMLFLYNLLMHLVLALLFQEYLCTDRQILVKPVKCICLALLSAMFYFDWLIDWSSHSFIYFGMDFQCL